MKKIPASFGLILLVLAGCAAQPNTTLHLSFSPESQDKHQELLDASVRVIQGRAAGMKTTIQNVKASLDGTGATIQFTMNDLALRDTIVNQLIDPFSFKVMTEAPKEQAAIWNDKVGGFAETGITEKDVTWTVANTMTGTTTGNAVISLTPAGQAQLQQVFAQNMGKQIGIFVRGRLMSRKYVNEADKKGEIVIDGIPSAGIASTFADDMNVGKHVLFQNLSTNTSSAASSKP